MRYTEVIVSYCEGLCTFPLRGTMRDDVRPGLRITHYKKRAVIAFDASADAVSIIGLFYSGQNYGRSCRTMLMTQATEPAKRGLQGTSP